MPVRKTIVFGNVTSDVKNEPLSNDPDRSSISEAMKLLLVRSGVFGRCEAHHRVQSSLAASGS